MTPVRYSTYIGICGQAVGVRLYDVFDILGRYQFRWDSLDMSLNFTSFRSLHWRPVKLQPQTLYAAPHQVILDVRIIYIITFFFIFQIQLSSVFFYPPRKWKRQEMGN